MEEFEKDMSQNNNERNLVKILKDLSIELQMKIEVFSFGWIIQLSKAGVDKFIFGYNFDLNSSASQMIASDKSATSEILKQNNVPVVEHILFVHPNRLKYINNENGNWEQMLSFLDRNKKIVCKSNNGTGGNNVHIVDSIQSLERISTKLFEKSSSICLSQFYEIETEYRLIIIKDKVHLCYKKSIPTLHGDGTKTVDELIKNSVSKIDFKNIDIDENIFDKVLGTNETLKLNWKNNLSKGAIPKVISSNSHIYSELVEIALNAKKSIGMEFASIDIIKTNNELKVLEINSGVMIENFLTHYPNEYPKIKEIYKSAVIEMFK